MAARQNLIVVVPRCWEKALRVLAALQATIEDWIGSLRTVSVQDFSTGSAQDRPLEGLVASEALPEVSDEEIVVLYPSDPRRGSVLLSHEGTYDLITLSLGEHAPALDRLDRIWRLVGGDATAVLAGEELEVEDEQIDTLIESGELPAELDLCDAAIVRVSGAVAELDMRNELLHGGRLLLR